MSTVIADLGTETPAQPFVRRLSANARVLVFALGLAATGGLLLSTTDRGTPVVSWVWLPALTLGFAIAESLALHVEIRKESHSLSVSGIPLMIGLIAFPPASVAVAYVIGGTCALLFVTRASALKALWNASLFVTQTGVAAIVAAGVIGHGAPTSTLGWTVLLMGVMAAELVSSVAVPLVIMTVDGTFRPNLFATLSRSQALAAFANCYAIVALRCVIGDPWMIAVSVAPVAAFVIVMRSTGDLTQRHRDLQQLHTFTSALTTERGSRTIDTGLRELADIMRAETSGLVIIDDDSDERSARTFGDDGFTDLTDDRTSDELALLVHPSDVTLITDADPRPEAAAVLRRLGATRILAAPALAEAERRGIVFVTNRLGSRTEYSDTELRLFGSLATTFSSRLSNDLLVDRLRSQARHDALTGLPNRLSFEADLHDAVGGGGVGQVVMIDLDRFKEINDSLGHATGDQLLTVIAARLEAAVGVHDRVARFGGDEFAILLTSGSLADQRARVLAIHTAVTETVTLGNISFETGASFGVASWPDHGVDGTTLLRRADIAMYEAKRNQQGVVWYSEPLDADSPRRTDLYLSASDAFERGDFYVEFQPKVSVTDGRITGAEALARRVHPEHGPISPTEFVPLLEHAGLTTMLTRFVIGQATIAVNRLLRVGHRLPVAVNLSPRDLLDPTLPDDVHRILKAADIPAGLLQIEITEDSMVVDFDTSAGTLQRLRELGVGVSLDDFGTGYASLQHLHRLPVDELKIDRSFIRHLHEDPSAAAIVRASINLATELGLRSVAEGVEDALTLRAVARLGCEEVQGYLVSPPVDLDEITAWVTSWDGAPLLTWLRAADDVPPPPVIPRHIYAVR